MALKLQVEDPNKTGMTVEYWRIGQMLMDRNGLKPALSFAMSSFINEELRRNGANATQIGDTGEMLMTDEMIELMNRFLELVYAELKKTGKYNTAIDV